LETVLALAGILAPDEEEDEELELEPDEDVDPDDDVEVEPGFVLALFAGVEADPPQPTRVAAASITRQVFTKILQL
jgi:hypothetical protein